MFWKKRTSEATEALALRFFTRQACPLCDEGKALLHDAIAASGRRVTLEVLDVDRSPQWVADFGDKVPVIEINGRVRAWGRFSKALLLREIQHA